MLAVRTRRHEPALGVGHTGAVSMPRRSRSRRRTAPRRAISTAGSGGMRAFANSVARRPAAPRRCRPGGSASSTTTPAATACRPGSRSTARSPARNGSARCSVRRAVPGAERAHPDRHGGRPDVQDHLCRKPFARLQSHVCDGREAKPFGRQQDITAPHLVHADAAKVQGHSRHRAHGVANRSECLNATLK